MFGTIKTLVAAGSILAVSSAAAHALTVKFDQPNMGFGEGPIIVESTDGVTWSKISSTELKLPYSLFIGHNSSDYKLAFYDVFLDGKRISPNTAVPLNGWGNPVVADETGTGSTDDFNGITRSNLLYACNKRLKNGGDIREDQTFFFKVPLQALARFNRKNGTWFQREARGHSMVHVTCKAFKDPKRKKKPLKISKLSFQAYATASSSLYKNKCPKQRVVRVKIEGNRKAKVKVFLFRDDGAKSEHIVPVSKPGEHYQYFVLNSAWVKNSETRKYYLVVQGHKLADGWKTVAIKCSSAGDDRPDEMASPTKPDPNQAKPKPQKPSRPQIIVRPVKPTNPVRPVVDLATPKLKCIGGKVKRNSCYCKQSYKKLKVARHTYRCVKMTTSKTPKRVKPNTKRRKAVRKNRRQQTNTPVLNMFKTVR